MRESPFLSADWLIGDVVLDDGKTYKNVKFNYDQSVESLVMLHAELIPGQTTLAPLADKGEHVFSTILHNQYYFGRKATGTQLIRKDVLGRADTVIRMAFLPLCNRFRFAKLPLFGLFTEVYAGHMGMGSEGRVRGAGLKHGIGWAFPRHRTHFRPILS